MYLDMLEQVRKPDGIYLYGNCVINDGIFEVGPVTEEQIDLYRSGEHVQHAFPHLNKAQREFIISGVSPSGWDELFGSEDDNDNED